MNTPPITEPCNDCQRLMREPTAPHAIRMAEHGFYNCIRLPAASFRTPSEACVFTPSRFKRKELVATHGEKA
jgi:hypothetical protein